MRSIPIVVSVLTATLGSLGFAQTDNWDALNTIPPGTKIKVTSSTTTLSAIASSTR